MDWLHEEMFLLLCWWWFFEKFKNNWWGYLLWIGDFFCWLLGPWTIAARALFSKLWVGRFHWVLLSKGLHRQDSFEAAGCLFLMFSFSFHLEDFGVQDFRFKWALFWESVKLCFVFSFLLMFQILVALISSLFFCL